MTWGARSRECDMRSRERDMRSRKRDVRSRERDVARSRERDVRSRERDVARIAASVACTRSVMWRTQPGAWRGAHSHERGVHAERDVARAAGSALPVVEFCAPACVTCVMCVTCAALWQDGRPRRERADSSATPTPRLWALGSFRLGGNPWDHCHLWGRGHLECHSFHGV